MIGWLSVLINSEAAWTSLRSSSFREFKLSTLLDISEINRCRFVCLACKDCKRKEGQLFGQDSHSENVQVALCGCCNDRPHNNKIHY